VPDLLTRVLRPLKDQLTQGVSPDALALTVTLGVLIGVFPIFGATTTLCVIAGVALKLNQPALQLANHAMVVPQVLLIPVFVKAGERLFGLAPVSFDPRLLPAQFLAQPAAFLRAYGRSGLAGTAVWALAAPVAGALLYYPLRRGFRKMGFLLGVKTAGTPIREGS
jgi:uncharacterized protein (DUF2062 family)